ncbi:MAG: Isoquinoline 1-oxidoreductase subunit [Polyangiaceae bacterium]
MTARTESSPVVGRGWLCGALVAALLGGCGETPTVKQAPGAPPPLPGENGLKGVSDFAQIQDRSQRSVALFEELGKVILSPRCVNCHSASDRPLQSEQGIPHQPAVVRGEEGSGAPGLPCSACHGETNFRNMPGAPKWSMPPLEMAWQDRTLGQICEQIKDPARNGDKSPAALIEHMKHDALVGYGWNPPAQLTPAVGSQALAGELFQAWVESGAVCPPSAPQKSPQ